MKRIYIIIKIIYFFLDRCWHKWTKIGRQPIYDDEEDAIGTSYHFQCTCCNKVKTKKYWGLNAPEVSPPSYYPHIIDFVITFNQ